jgi:hypothetical protein
MSHKLKIGKKEILSTITEQSKLIKEDLEKFIGADEDRKIEYPTNPGIENPDDMSAQEAPSEFSDGNDVAPGAEGAALAAKMKSPPSELLSYLEKLEEAKSILSKVAAKESDQEVKNKIYQHYEKVQKTAFEMIKEFGIVH